MREAGGGGKGEGGVGGGGGWGGGRYLVGWGIGEEEEVFDWVYLMLIGLLLWCLFTCPFFFLSLLTNIAHPHTKTERIAEEYTNLPTKSAGKRGNILSDAAFLLYTRGNFSLAAGVLAEAVGAFVGWHSLLFPLSVVLGDVCVWWWWWCIR